MSTRCLLFGLFALSLFGCTQYAKNTLPDFPLRLTNGKVLNLSDRLGDGAALVIHFDADCGACQKEAQKIVDNITAFNEVSIVFVSEQDTGKINVFDKYFGLTNHTNISVAQDTGNRVAKHFQDYTTPLTAVLNKRREVHAVITGEAEVEEILKFIHETQ